MKNVYLVEVVYYDAFDSLENENVEDRYIIGYFSVAAKAEQAIKECVKHGIPKNTLCVKEFEFPSAPNQKYVYVLNYEYSRLTDNGYEDYYYYFAPQSNKAKCLEQKKQLLLCPKYQPTAETIFTTTKDGFFVDKIKIDFLSHVDYRELNE